MHYGVREHGMGAIVNGLNLHGLRAFGSTFFTFSDYMKGAIRLGAIQHLPAIYVFTHDSIGLGEDGPTHQPIEQLAHLRATPNLYMVRPAGANETALAWRFALEQTSTPVAMALSRQGLPVWNPSAVPDDAIHRGAYMLREAFKEGDPDVILIGTGSEVHICNDGRRPARGRRDRHPGRLRALSRALRRAGRGLPRRRSCRRPCGRGSRSRRPPRSAGLRGRPTTATRSA